MLVACQTPMQNAFYQVPARQNLQANSLTQQQPASIQKFKQIDQNQDHFISVAELTAVQGNEAAGIIANLDFDRDGQMSFSEFYVSSFGPGPTRNDITPPPGFISADKNQDQFLTLEELAVGNMSPDAVRQIIQAADFDRDNRLSLGEYLNTSWSPGPLYYFR
ncbi:MAG: EF-hand domain-containing protein [Candidatus Sericytochromatia bacterium]|nr:EF-hand domain-containing protein [Candidatus Sericytochromatia bacterium]